MSKTLRLMNKSRSNKGRPMATRTERRRAAVDRRREFTRKSVTAQVAARRRRSRIRWSAAAVGVAALGAGGIALIASRDDGGIPNVTLTGKEVDADGALGITAPLDAYTIDYDVTYYGSDPENPSTGSEQVRVSRPFGSIATFTDADGVTSTYTSVLGKSSALDDGTTTVYARAAGAAQLDWRLDATLDDLVTSGKFQLQERREVAGRECQVYRTGTGLEAENVTDATETDYAEMCIDASGLMLEEVVYLSGLPAQHIKATAVSQDPVGDITVDGEPTDTTTSVSEISADEAPAETYWTLATVPEGYEHVGRYAYTQPDTSTGDTTTDTTIPTDTTIAADTTLPVATTLPTGTTVPTTAADSTAPGSSAQGFAGSNVLAAATTEAPGDDETTTTAAPETTAAPATTVAAEEPTTTVAPTPTVVSYLDVYRNGADYLIVHQGATGQEPATPGATSEATLEPLGAVTKASGVYGSQILGHPAATPEWFVSITASVDMETLSTIAATLTS